MILDEITRHKREEVASRKRERPLASLEAELSGAGATRGFRAALAQSAQGQRRRDRAAGHLPQTPPLTPRLIAEIKERSPSKGAIRTGIDPVQVARAYKDGGAACLSVLTDSKFFGGAICRIAEVRAAVDLPVLQKDFVVDPYQIVEARLCGADCVLLIAAALEESEMREMHELAASLGLDALVEAHSRDELERALTGGYGLIGLNNRNLQTFEVSLDTTLTLAPLVPPDRVLVGESGIYSREDVDRVAHAGVDAVLVGEALMTAEDIAGKARELCG